MQYCIQCEDKKSGQVGNFLHHGDLLAISPIFSSLTDFFRYLKSEGLMVGSKQFDIVPIP